MFGNSQQDNGPRYAPPGGIPQGGPTGWAPSAPTGYQPFMGAHRGAAQSGWDGRGMYRGGIQSPRLKSEAKLA